jgi:hypothetical protein
VLTSILVRLAFGSGDTPASAEQRPCQHEREDNGPRPIVARAVLVSSSHDYARHASDAHVSIITYLIHRDGRSMGRLPP